ncbi:F-box protein [Aspergillus lucknowensis]|uniref:F-box domain-containing protein n=1 Tax=Aspergillus lucknowensis TaxID=176173 RepID=A0ABR4LW23_9EURO
MPDLVDDTLPKLDTGSRGPSTKVATEIPPSVTKRLLAFVPDSARRSLRLTCKSWAKAIDAASPPLLPTANTLPPEIITQIFSLLSPRDFDNARRTCSQWMRASLNEGLLESMLKRAGWWDSWLWDNRMRHSSSPTNPNAESPAWRMSKRFATECILSGRKMNVERSGFLTTSVVDFSQLSQHRSSGSRHSRYDSTYSKDHDVLAASSFQVSGCGNYVLVISGSTIHIYHLLTSRSGSSAPTSAKDLENTDIATIACVTCPSDALSAAIDTTTTSQFTVAALMHNRLGMVCDLVPASWQDSSCSTETVYDATGSMSARNSGLGGAYSMKMTSRHFFYDVCSAEDPPRSVSICPGQRCVAFGADAGIELRWVDQQTNKDRRKHFPMSQPSEILHFMPNRPDTPLEFRLISSLAGPGIDGCGCENLPPNETRPSCPFHAMQNDVQTFSRWTPEQNDHMSLVRTTQCHHYRAVPVNDGLHVLFIEPRTGFLCIGSDAPIDGPTSLTRALTCVPPFCDTPDASKAAPLPTAFATGSDLNWGLRVIAAYGDRLVFYSVPLDVFNVIKKERERQGDGIMADSDLARDFFLNQERSQARRRSLSQNQNGDWEFLLSISYRPTAMMWPFKIYGKEIGQVENVVELALQSSHGGARVWAFGASGETRIIDVDTFTKTSQQASDIPCKSFTIGPDGRIASAQLVNRSKHGLIAPDTPRKRKQYESRADFVGRRMLRHQSSPATLHGQDTHSSCSSNNNNNNNLILRHQRRPSFAARIVDVRIPELEGRWIEPEAVY